MIASLLLLAAPALAHPSAVQSGSIPPGYYDTVDTASQPALRASLHAIIDDHTRFPYTSGSTDTWDILEIAQQNPANTSQILDVYRNRSFTKQGGGNSSYNREHTWPKSYGFPDDDGMNMPFTDCHLLNLCDDGYNTARSNKPYGQCTAGCNEQVTDANGGVGGGSGAFPGNSNWFSGSFSSGTYQVNPFRRGDMARGLLYAAIRYEGGNHGGTGVSEPDLMLTDNLGLIAASNTGNNENLAYMGRLSILLAWHLEDPVDAFEMNRNDVIASFQGNRNPFIDHPEWVACAFTGDCDPGGAYCSPAVGNSSGQPAMIVGVGSVVIADNNYRLVVSQLPPNQFGFFLGSQSMGFVANPGGSQGNLCLGGEIGRAVGGQIVSSGVFGSFDVLADLNALPLPSGPVQATAGETWHFQAWYRDIVLGFPASNFTDAWAVTWQ